MNRDVNSLKSKSLTRITQNIENDRNSDKKLSQAYKERYFRYIADQYSCCHA